MATAARLREGAGSGATASGTTELLREIRRIEIQTSRLVAQHLAGSYQSVFKGRGISFAEVRPYTAGDDVRAIDWNVTARTGEPYVKLFSEERELTVMLVVDMSASLDLGSRGHDKRHSLVRLAATVAFSAITNADRVGLVGFTDRIEAFMPPRSGRKHVLAVLSRLLNAQPSGRGTDPVVALEFLARLRRSGTVAFLFSDFVEAAVGERAPALERALKLVRRRHDLVCVRVEDRIELELPPLGLVSLEDLELLGAGAVTHVDLGRGRARRYAEAVARERSDFERVLRKLSLELVDVKAGSDWQAPLVAYFGRRARRRRR
jgi:uncharacterized protein (DUF58 family)